MGQDHSHDHVADANTRMLGWALALTATFLIVEVAGGLYFNSLALLSDAGHMLTDVAALAIALLAIRLGAKPPDERRTFGYRRSEILAATSTRSCFSLSPSMSSSRRSTGSATRSRSSRGA